MLLLCRLRVKFTLSENECAGELFLIVGTEGREQPNHSERQCQH